MLTNSNSIRSLAALSAIALLLALGACSSPGPSRSSGSSAKGGGYYMDDGPGDRSSLDLAAIPDARPRAEPLSARANRPYVVFGRRYTPMTELADYRERGMASWYGRKFHGQKTSNGEIYDMYGMTGASPVLPIPSFVRVTHLRNGRSVVVRINDRGPFLNGRLIDLSYTAAAKLGYVEAGSAEVQVELITRFDGVDAPTAVVASQGPAATPSGAGAGTSVGAGTSAGTSAATIAPAGAVVLASTRSLPDAAAVVAPASESRLNFETVSAPAPAADAATPPPAYSPPPYSVAAQSQAPARSIVAPGAHWLQLGAFASRENAEAGRSRISQQFDWLAGLLQIRRDGAMYKIQAGPFAQRDDALLAAERIRAATELKPFATSR